MSTRETRFWSLFLCSALCFLACRGSLAQERAPFLTAIIDHDTLFVAHRARGEADALHLLRTPLPSAEAKVTEFQTDGLSRQMMMRWRISHGCVWAAGGAVGETTSLWRIPRHDLELFNFKPISQGIDPFEPLEKQFPISRDPRRAYQWWLDPLHDILVDYITRHNVRLIDVPAQKDQFFDFVPTSADGLDLFLLKKNTLSVLEAREGKFIQAEENWRHKWSKKPVRTYHSPFCEPFMIYKAGDQHFFVTKSGNIYTDRPLDTKKPELTPFLTDATKPIEAIVTDIASGKTFVFGSEPKLKHKYVCELGPKLVLFYFDCQTIKPVKARPPLDRAIGYANFLKETKRVKDK